MVMIWRSAETTEQSSWERSANVLGTTEIQVPNPETGGAHFFWPLHSTDFWVPAGAGCRKMSLVLVTRKTQGFLVGCFGAAEDKIPAICLVMIWVPTKLTHIVAWFCRFLAFVGKCIMNIGTTEITVLLRVLGCNASAVIKAVFTRVEPVLHLLVRFSCGHMLTAPLLRLLVASRVAVLLDCFGFDHWRWLLPQLQLFSCVGKLPLCESLRKVGRFH